MIRKDKEKRKGRQRRREERMEKETRKKRRKGKDRNKMPKGNMWSSVPLPCCFCFNLFFFVNF